MSSRGETNYFSNASNVVCNNLNITHVNGNMHTSSLERHGLKLLLENIVKGAVHDAAERGDPPKCHSHTRVAIRTEIMEWINAPEVRRKFILWMYGPAGSGKTAIGQSIAEECKRRGLLAASFFFARTAPGRNNTAQVVATIAYQISRFLPQIEDDLFTTIERDPTIFSRTPAVQMQTLVIEPLRALPPLPQPIFVILDGLDEAGPTPQSQANLLNIIGTATTELRHISIIFLIASRPEYEIREAFNGHLSQLTRSLVLDDNYKPDDDIRLYLTSTFKEIRDKHLRLGTRLPSPWPAESDIDHLVSKSSGQFIFAATVLKFIDSIRHHPEERLGIILDLSVAGNETPFALLDELYHYILSSVAEPAKVLEILVLLVLGNPEDTLFVSKIDKLLNLEVRRVLVDMHALVFVPSPSDNWDCLRIHHASLHDFLMDRSRSHGFYIDASQGHIKLTWCWWELIINKQFSEELDMQMCFWNFVHHYQESPGSIELTDDLARFDLKHHLEEDHNFNGLYLSPWRNFFCCIEEKAGDWDDVFPRLQDEFKDFILDRFWQYPPTLQAYIPTILDFLHSTPGTNDIFRLLLCGLDQPLTKCDKIHKLDSILLGLDSRKFCSDKAISDLSRTKYLFGEYYACDKSYLALANQIVKILFPNAGKDYQQVRFDNVLSGDDNSSVLYLKNGSLHVRLYDLDFYWFAHMFLEVPQDLELGTLLRERALQYYVYGTELDIGRHTIAYASLSYIQKCGISYLNHVHPPDTNRCIICKICPGKSVVVDWDQHNKSDATTFPPPPTLEFPSSAEEVEDHHNGLDESRTSVPIDPSAISVISSLSPPRIFRNPGGSSTLTSSSEALPTAEPSTKSKRKRGAQRPPGELRRSTRFKMKKTAS